MLKQESFSNYQYKVYEIYSAIYKNEKFFENNIKNTEYQGYLIEKNLIDKINKDGEYEKIKPLLDNESYGTLKEKIKDNKEALKDIIPKKFNKSNELIKELKKNECFYFIHKNYVKKITSFINKDYETKFIFDKDNNVVVIFDENDKLVFLNNKKGIIDKELLLDKSLLKTYIANNQHNYAKTNDSSFNKIKFKDDLEILIRIFFFNKYLREKENNFFNNLNNGENSESVYLINNSWMEEYKSFFNYKYIEDYLTNEKEYWNLFVTNNYLLSSEIKNKIMTNLTPDYINEINKKEGFDKNKTFKYEKNVSNNRISYPYNNHIINHKIYESLIRLNYKLNDSIKKIDLYFIGSKRILLLNREDFKKEVDEIGFINEQGLFIPEYLLEYIEKNTPISLEILNTFFINDFSKFYHDEKIDCCDIKDEQNKLKGHCFKLDINKINELDIKKIETTKVNDEIKNENNHDDKNIDKKLNFVTPEDNLNKDNNETAKQIDIYIELMINIYLFKEELKNKINRNLVNTHEETYYIITQKWMNKLKQFLDYDKFVKYLELGNYKKIIDKYNLINNYNKFISEIIDLFPQDYTKDIHSKTEDAELRNSQYYSMKWKEKNGLYFYFDNIEIINEKITEIIEKLFNIEYKEKRMFLLGDKKIIMDFSLEYETSNQFSIITGDYTKDYFETDFLLHFFNKNDIHNYFQIFTSKGYDYVINNLIHPQNKEIYMIDNTKSFSIGKAYKIFELWNKGNSIINNQSTNIKMNIDINSDNDNNEMININQIQLNLYIENQIKALISYYLFTEKLKQNINTSPKIIYECYLVDSSWMEKYVHFFLYDEIIQQILKHAVNESLVDKIYKNFDNEFLLKIKENETKNNNVFGGDIAKILSSYPINNFIESGNKNDIAKYYNFKFKRKTFYKIRGIYYK